MAAGFSDSIIKVWSLVPQKLRGMKPADLLADIDKEAGKIFFLKNYLKFSYPKILLFIEDVLVRMMDDRTGETMKVLHGHTGPVYAISFSPDRSQLVSASEDASSNKLTI